MKQDGLSGGGARIGKAASGGGARRVALRALLALEESERRRDGTGLELLLDRELEAAAARGTGPLDGRDRALARELAYGVTRRRRTLDYLLGPALGARKLDPLVRNALRMAAYQIHFLERVPVHAAVDTAVELVKAARPRAAGLVNAVLRRLLREGWPALPEDGSAEALAVRHSFPDWLAARWRDRYGPEQAGRLMEWMNGSPDFSLRVNRLRTSTEALRRELAEAGWATEPGRYLEEALVAERLDGLTDLPAFREGRFSVQDESSMLVAHVLDPRPGERILDLAAAPGGKSAHIQERAGNQAEILACDVAPERLERVRRNALRLGLAGIHLYALDGRKAGDRWPGGADRALLDAPCSGTGVLHRRPDARWRKSSQGLRRITALQAELLDAACACLRPGGVLVYSTCSLEPEENQEQVKALLSRRPEMRPDPIAAWLPAGLAARAGSAPWIQLLPTEDGLDGFFIARLRREG